jgi:hypothetical protein
MVRASQATTFSSESYFDDRGVYGYAQPITEHVNVRELTSAQHDVSLISTAQPHSRPIVSYYFPEGVGGFHYGVSRSSSRHETLADFPNSNTIL